jgi:stage II sporulation protein D
MEVPGRGTAPVTMALEESVAGVLAGEANEFRSPESLKAMAVAIRTFAIRNRGRHKAEGFDLCDTTHCQDFRRVAITARLRSIAQQTAGELLWYRGATAMTFYTKHCGGYREASDRVWPDITAPYLRAAVDPNCGSDDWSSIISRETVANAMSAAGLRAPRVIDRITVAQRSAGKRALRLEVGGVAVSASSFRFAIGRADGWDKLPSSWYDVDSSGTDFRFSGHGHGHGVGLCQRGAHRMGEAGKSYREILAFYYPGTVLGLTAQGQLWQTISGERVIMQTTQPDQDRMAIPIADRLLHEVESATGLSLTARPTLRVHPTIPEFRDATGAEGWVAAITRESTIDVQPLGVLRSQAGLERTLRHEMAHVVIEQNVGAILPIWFREGLALWIDGVRLPRPMSIPADGALNRAIQRPLSAEERRQSYSVAHGLVSECIRRYGKAAVFDWVKRGFPPELTYASISQAVTAAK